MTIPQEIERKFLVHIDRLPPEAKTGGSCFAQGYLSSKPAVRVRLADGGTDHAKAWITIKGPGLMTRSEFEYEIPPRDAEELLKLCPTSLTKVRRKVQVGQHTWEIDQFTGAHVGLWLAEIELTHEQETFEIPTWLGNEVTADKRFTNSNLAKTLVLPLDI